MKAQKDSDLEKCHSNFLDICFGDFPMEQIPMHVDSRITGFGTNINEKIQSFSAFKELLQLQREESVGLEMDFEFEAVSKTVFAKGFAAIYIDEAVISMTVEGKGLELFLRISTVFEFIDDKWKAIHFHGSFPQGEEGDQDTWKVNEWKQKNEELERIIKEKTKDLKESLENLKATQAQLIHSEKMASLGQLTAGIAHEIKNPLNFVNNFSEVSKELLEEMNEELNNKNYDLAVEIAGDVSQNLNKILHHGKRADGIVKGMLQHSRSNSSKKEPVEVNSFVDEYLRLAYHGLRAKDKSFNAKLETNFDEKAEKLWVVPQELGRVVLNLVTNAFYAVRERKTLRQAQGKFRQGHVENSYEPTVWVSTHRKNEVIEIKIRDNGIGIPEEIKDKIFQPFFTTKPTGQGTGLGLSLSYDIVKAHGGEIKMETEVNKGSLFIIQFSII